MRTYRQIKDQQPILWECFFAFGDKQFTEGRIKAGLDGKKIYSGGAGLYGSRGGIKKLYADYDDINKQVAAECNPQDVYDYEFNNHECSYTNDDTEAIKIVDSIFGTEKALEVKRRFGYTKISELWKEQTE